MDIALYDLDEIVNVIICESTQLAEEITGLNAIECINGEPKIGWILYNNQWVPPKPFDSWTWTGNKWEAPVERPNDENEYYWDEESQQWILV